MEGKGEHDQYWDGTRHEPTLVAVCKQEDLFVKINISLCLLLFAHTIFCDLENNTLIFLCVLL